MMENNSLVFGGKGEIHLVFPARDIEKTHVLLFSRKKNRRVSGEGRHS